MYSIYTIYNIHKYTSVHLESSEIYYNQKREKGFKINPGNFVCRNLRENHSPNKSSDSCGVRPSSFTLLGGNMPRGSSSGLFPGPYPWAS